MIRNNKVSMANSIYLLLKVFLENFHPQHVDFLTGEMEVLQRLVQGIMRP